MSISHGTKFDLQSLGQTIQTFARFGGLNIQKYLATLRKAEAEIIKIIGIPIRDSTIRDSTKNAK